MTNEPSAGDTAAPDIEPDVKNWTWVLERRCPDCGFDAGAFDAATSGATIRALAIQWADVLARRDPSTRSRPTVWSPLEYGCHVRDAFLIFDGRLRTMLDEVDPLFENWDQDETAVAGSYGSQDPATVSAELTAAAEVIADRFDGVEAGQWSRRGSRSDGSCFTVESLARYLIHDPVHHLWDVGVETSA